MERQRQPTIQPTVPDNSAILGEIYTDIVSMCKKNKYGCIGFWVILVMIISIVIAILWAECYLGGIFGSGCCQNTPGKKTLFRNGDARANGRRHENR